MCVVALKTIFLAIFLPIIIKEFVANFIFIKMPCFQHIFLNTFRWMRLKYENYFLKRILFQTFKQHSRCKSLIAKTFDEIRIKMKTASPIQVTKKKKNIASSCFSIDVHIEFNFASPFFFFFSCPIGRANKLGRPKKRAWRSKFVQPCCEKCLVLIKVAGCTSATLLKLNFFSGIFHRF